MLQCAWVIVVAKALRALQQSYGQLSKNTSNNYAGEIFQITWYPWSPIFSKIFWQPVFSSQLLTGEKHDILAPCPSLVRNIWTYQAKTFFLQGIEDKLKECLLCFHGLCSKDAKSVYKFKESTTSRVASTTDSDCFQNTLYGQALETTEERLKMWRYQGLTFVLAIVQRVK